MARIGGAGRFFRGLAGGAAGAIVVGLVLMGKNALGLFAGADVIAMLAELVNTGYRIDGWLTMLVAGSLLGVAFAYVKQWFSGPLVRRALLFSLSTWAAVLLILAAAASAGAMADGLSIALAAVLLLLLVVYGLVLGTIYGGLQHVHVAQRRRRYVTLDTTHWGTRSHS